MGNPYTRRVPGRLYSRALEGCIEGHKSLRKAGFLHRDISINNLMVNEDDDNPSWPSFLIDLDLAIKEQRGGVSGAKGKTGTRAFMAIGALLGDRGHIARSAWRGAWARNSGIRAACRRRRHSSGIQYISDQFRRHLGHIR